MPRVAQYGFRTVEAAPAVTPYQQISAPAQAFGMGGQGLAQASQELDRASSVADEIGRRNAQLKAQDDEAFVKENDNAFTADMRNVLFDPDNGYYAKKGKDAYNAYQDTQKQLQDLKTKYSSTMTDQHTRQLFENTVDQRINSASADIDQYALKERNGWLDATDQASAANAISDASTYWNNPQKVQLAINTARGYVRNQAERNGWPPEQVMMEQRNTDTKVHLAVVNGMASAQDYGGALNYLDAHQDDMNPVTADYRKALQDGAVRQKATYNVASLNAVPATVSPEVPQKIATTAAAAGVPADIALTIANRESSMGANTQNPVSSAGGVFQITDGTWADRGGTKDNRGNVDSQIEVGVDLIKDNMDTLKANLGRDPQGWEVGLAHQQGVTGATKLLRADPNALASNVVGHDEVANNMTADQKAATDPAKVTVGQYLALQQQGYEQAHISPAALGSQNVGQRTAQLQQIMQIKDPQERDETMRQFKAQNTLQDEATTASQKQAGDSAFMSVVQGQDPRAFSLDQIRSMGPDAYKSLVAWNDSQVTQSRKIADDRTNAALIDMSVRDPAQFQKVQILPLVTAGALSSDNGVKLIQQQQTTGNKAYTDSLKMADDISKPLLLSAGIWEPGTPSAGKTLSADDAGRADLYGEFKVKLAEQIKGMVAAKNAPLTDAETSSLVHNMLFKTTFTNGAATRDSYSFDRKDLESPSITNYSDIPAGDATRLAGALNRNGFTVDGNQGIQAIYASILTGDVGQVQMAINAHTKQHAGADEAGDLFRTFLNPAYDVPRDFPTASVSDLQRGALSGNAGMTIGAAAGDAATKPRTPASPPKEDAGDDRLMVDQDARAERLRVPND